MRESCRNFRNFCGGAQHLAAYNFFAEVFSVLYDELVDGVERARQFAIVVAQHGFERAAEREDITGYPPKLLKRMLKVSTGYDSVLLNYTDAAPYILAENNLQWNSFLRACRGIIFGTNGALLSFPFHKFFNINEHNETQAHNVARWQIRSATEKVDGVMIQVYERGGELVFASRHAVWSNAAITAYETAHSALQHVWRALPARRKTLICELVHPQHRKVGMVDYGDMRALVLLFVRDLDTYELTPCCEVFSNSAHELPDPLMLPATYNERDFYSLYNKVKSAQTREWEGIVLQATGARGNLLVKIKNPLYLDRIAAIKHITPSKLLQNYELGGLEQARNLLAGYEEIARALGYTQLLEELKKEEEAIEMYARSVKDKPVSEIEPNMRWVKTYEVGSPKWELTKRKLVVQKIKSRRR